jgi:hypothetical protein
MPDTNFLIPVYGSLLEVVALWVERLEQDRWYYVPEGPDGTRIGLGTRTLTGSPNSSCVASSMLSATLRTL